MSSKKFNTGTKCLIEGSLEMGSGQQSSPSSSSSSSSSSLEDVGSDTMEDQDTELIIAAGAGDRDECASILESIHNNRDYHITKRGVLTTALIEAAKEGHLDIVEILMKHGADIHDKTIDGDSPIIYASEQGHVNVLGLLLSNGADPNDKDKYAYNSPIILASHRGHVNVVDLLL